MTLRRWLGSVMCSGVWAGVFWYAVHHITGSWGLVILAACYVQGFLLLTNTVDLLFGRWLRRGPALPVVQSHPPGRIRRVIFEDIVLD